MAYNASSNVRAKDADRYFVYRLWQDDANSQMTLFDGNVGVGTSVDNDCAQPARNTLLSGYTTDFGNLSVWGFTKNANNPLIAVDEGQGTLEFYPPSVLKVGSSWMVVGKVANEIWGSTSSDGITWAAPTKFLAKGTSGQWDDIVVSPGAFAIENGVYKILYSGYGDSPAYNYKTGYAYNSDFQSSGWTKSGSYILDVSAYNTKYGTSWDSIRCSDAIKVGSRWYYFGHVYNNTFDNGELIYGVGEEGADFEDVVLDTRIATYNEINSYHTWISSLSVIKHPTSGEYYMTFTMGNLKQNSSKSNQATYLIESGRTDAPIFSKYGFTSFPILICNESLAWENNQVYGAKFLRGNDGVPEQVSGSYYMYYSAHENTSSPTYTGAMCLATINIIP